MQVTARAPQGELERWETSFGSGKGGREGLRADARKKAAEKSRIRGEGDRGRGAARGATGGALTWCIRACWSICACCICAAIICMPIICMGLPIPIGLGIPIPGIIPGIIPGECGGEPPAGRG